jgi:universal stress protein A
MKNKNTKRKIVETAVGAAIGGAIAGPAGAIAGGIIGNKASSPIDDRDKPSRQKKRAKGVVLRPNLKRILVPVDFSSESLSAVRFARDWAARFRAAVCLLHVTEPVIPAPSFGAQPIAVPLPPRGLRARLKAELEKIAKKELPRTIKTTVEIREGIPYDAIVTAAKKLKADLIIISSHGRTGLVRFFMGSTAERVVRHAPCPVLTLRSAAAGTR